MEPTPKSPIILDSSGRISPEWERYFELVSANIDTAVGGAVTSVFGRGGAVLAVAGDYNHSQIGSVGANDHHNEVHNIASHSDTTATGAELETLTNGSNADSLHTHPALSDHGSLGGLDDDDHPQYLQRSIVNGSFKETFDALVTSAAGVVTMSLEQPSGGDLVMQFSDGLTTLDCTPACTIELTAGSESSPQVNYIYIPLATKVLTKSTSSWPSTEHIKVGFFFVQSAAGVVSDGGALINQNWNDHLAGTNEMGHILHIAEKLRLTGATYFSGVDGNGATGYLTAGVGTTDFKSTAGLIYQLHKQGFIAIDTSVGDTIHVKNWNGDSYHEITDLFDITDDSGGNTIGNNKYFNLTIWGVANKNGEHESIMINLPSGFYNGQSSAENDISGYDDFTIPREFSIDSSVGFLIARITIQMGTTWTHVSEVDLRGTSPQTASGGASGAITKFADNQFSVFNVSDITKILNLDLSGVTTGNTRILTPLDKDYTIGDFQADGSIPLSGPLEMSGDITPSQITAQEDDYNPTGLSGASVLRLSSDASQDMTGLQGGADGRLLYIHNIDVNDIVLKDEDANSSAANRFALNADVTIEADNLVVLQYDSTSLRWKAIAGGGGGGASTFLGLTDTPSSYVGQSGKRSTVNATEDGIEFTSELVIDGGNATDIRTSRTRVIDGGGA